MIKKIQNKTILIKSRQMGITKSFNEYFKFYMKKEKVTPVLNTPISDIRKEIQEYYCPFWWFEGCEFLGYTADGDSMLFTQGMGFDSKKHQRTVFCISVSFLERIIKDKTNFFEQFTRIKKFDIN